MNIDIRVLSDLSRRLAQGEIIRPSTNGEKACYKLITDLDHVSGHVKGSITTKKIYV
jgi:hypothetical protein